MHSLMFIAKAGLASPADIDLALDGVVQALEKLPQELQVKSQFGLDPLLAEVKQEAVKNWKG